MRVIRGSFMAPQCFFMQQGRYHDIMSCARTQKKKLILDPHERVPRSAAWKCNWGCLRSLPAQIRECQWPENFFCDENQSVLAWYRLCEIYVKYSRCVPLFRCPDSSVSPYLLLASAIPSLPTQMRQFWIIFGGSSCQGWGWTFASVRSRHSDDVACLLGLHCHDLYTWSSASFESEHGTDLHFIISLLSRNLSYGCSFWYLIWRWLAGELILKWCG